MQSSHQRRRIFSAPLVFLALAIFLIALILGLQGLFPQLHCPIKAGCGIKCPGCGGTSAFHSLIEGNIAAALRQNLLLIGGFFSLILWSICEQIYQFKTGKSPSLPITLGTGITVIIAIIAFTVLRNL